MANELLQSRKDGQQWLSTIRTSSVDWNSYNSMIKSRVKSISKQFLDYTGSDKTVIKLPINSLLRKEGEELLIRNSEFPDGTSIKLGEVTQEQQNLSCIKSIPNKQLLMGHPLNNTSFGMSVLNNINNDSGEYSDSLGLTDDEISDMYIDDCVFGNNEQCIQSIGKESGISAYNIRIQSDIKKLPSTKTYRTSFISFNYKRPSSSVLEHDGYILKYKRLTYKHYKEVKKELYYIKELSGNRLYFSIDGSSGWDYSFTTDCDVIKEDEWNNIVIQFMPDLILVFINNIYVGEFAKNSKYDSYDLAFNFEFDFFPLYMDSNTELPRGARVSQFEFYNGTYDFAEDYDYLMRKDNKIPYLESFDISDNNLESDPEVLIITVPHKIEFSMAPDSDSIEDNYELGERESFFISKDVDHDGLLSYEMMTEVFPKVDKSGKAFQMRITADKYFILDSGGITNLDV